MKNVLLTVALIAAAVASGDLLAQATVPKTLALREHGIDVAARNVRHVWHARETDNFASRSESRLRARYAWLDSEKSAAK
jgi:hypothetical protein